MQKAPKKIMPIIVTKKAWKDTWHWLLGTKLGWIIAIVVCGMLSSIFVGNSLIERILAGSFGAIVAIILIVGATFIINLIMTPPRIRRENRRIFIEHNASYIPVIIGNPLKQKYLTILDILESMIKIENEITDNMVGKRKLTVKEFNMLQKNLSKKTNIPTLPYHKAVKVFQKGEATKKVEETITKMKLNIMGDKLSENQIQFLIQTRSTVDDFGIGLSDELKNPSKYAELITKLHEQIPEFDDKTPDWIIYLLVIPSSFNNLYLFWHALPIQAKIAYFKNTTPKIIAEFQSERESSIKQLLKYTRDSIEKL